MASKVAYIVILRSALPATYTIHTGGTGQPWRGRGCEESMAPLSATGLGDRGGAEGQGGRAPITRNHAGDALVAVESFKASITSWEMWVISLLPTVMRLAALGMPDTALRHAR